MDWTAFRLSVELAAWTTAILLPIGLLVGRWLAYHRFRGRGFVEALIALPLVLPPTVLGYYLLVSFSRDAPIGQLWLAFTGDGLNFSFAGIVLASVIFNLPFAIQPVQRAFETVPAHVREAAWCCGLSTSRTLTRIELPLIWPGLISAMVLTFVHTIGEFGVVLMVGGAIDGETKTVAIAIYDRVQAFDDEAAGAMSLVLLIASFIAIGLVYGLAGRARGVGVR
ncbi:molybdate transport system permease protein [Natronocella acetinitrilica]|uniref:Molybdenum transport system permease n=1 Tax=Natronocella acetinitrilica TaxID=414046 RepID=A0AAE3G5U3_9GAMM|nr:molybdate ABC transporter permease subunit [Natronocella acetinitrilica]MCP1676381.1 molybdate transport system permease protein [Natronocella acetinitrilica]